MTDKIDRVLKQLHTIEINQAVTHERLKETIKDGGSRDVAISDLSKKVQKHDTIFGAIAVLATVLTVVFGLVLNTEKIIGIKDKRKASPQTVIIE
mgnify:CR=1 FL=1